MTQRADVTEKVLSYIRHQATKGPAGLAALMERTAADCARCLEGLSQEQATFHYDQEWSITEVLDHMLSSGASVNRQIAGQAEDSSASGGARAGVVSGDDRPIGAMRQTLDDLWREAARLAASMPRGGPERTFKHPFFGPLNYSEWIAFQRVHAMDHIQQMEKVKAHPDYPKA